ncbi:MAG TPA: zf-HC2 domain-containing protein [Ktedonobacterales bacterium]|nr:zf-HC2 domain-containing protein [Ktedonobacterales bacterium]
MTPEISCNQCRDYLMEFTAGLLPPDTQSAVARHLATCAECQREYAAWRTLSNAIHARAHAIPDDTRAADGWARLEAALTSQAIEPAQLAQPAQPMAPALTANATSAPPPNIPFPVHMRDRERAMIPNDPDSIVIESLRQAKARRDAPGVAIGALSVRQPELTPTRQPNRIWYGVIPTVVALLLIALSVALFAGLHQSRGGVGTSPIGQQQAASCAASDITASFPTSGALDGPFFDGVQMLSPTDGWTLGRYQTGSLRTPTDHSFILHFANCHWGAVANPVPNDDLSSLSMVSATDGWALGNDPSTDAQVVLHYTGDAWHIVTLPVTISPPPTDASTPPRYGSLAMVSATEGWLTTMYRDQNGVMEGDVFHELDGKWTQVDMPSSDAAFPATPIGHDEAWLLTAINDGSETVWFYGPGQLWSSDVSVLPAGTGIDFAGTSPIQVNSPRDAWLSTYMQVGGGPRLPTRRVILHYNGSTWAHSSLANNPLVQSATTVVVFSANDGWAFLSAAPAANGAAGTNCGPAGVGGAVTGALRLHKGRWQRTTFQPQNIGCLSNVTRVGPDEYWAVGTTLAKDASSVQKSTGNQVLLHEVGGVWAVYGG